MKNSSISHNLSMNSPLPMGMPSDYKKIFCAYHPTQFLTNFCLQKQCLMPLCPTCVVQHTQQHYQSKQKPSYINLNDALHEVRQKCYGQIVSLEECHHINEQINDYIEGLRMYIKKQLLTCKQTVFDHINVIFQGYEKILIKQVQQKYKAQEVYNFQESRQIKEDILTQIQGLYDKISLIKSDQCLAALIKYYGQDQQAFEEGIIGINQYLQKNKKAGGIHIGLDQQKVVEILKDFCQKSIVLTTIYQQDLKKQKQQPAKQKKKSSKLMTTSNRKFDIQQSKSRRSQLQMQYSPAKKKQSSFRNQSGLYRQGAKVQDRNYYHL